MRALNRTSESFDVALERSKRVSNQRRLSARRARLQRLDIQQAEDEMREAQGRSLSDYLMTAGRYDLPFARSLA